MEAEERMPPSDLAAEMAVVGSLMLCGDDAALFAKTRASVRAEAFYDPDLRAIFDAVCKLADEGRPIDAIATRSRLCTNDGTKQERWTELLGRALAAVPSPLHGPEYGRIVSDRYRRRTAMQIAARIHARMTEQDGDLEPEEVMRRAAVALVRLASSASSQQVWTLEEIVHAWADRRQSGHVAAVLTGVRALDENYAGIMRKSGLTVIAGRTSMGKSTFTRWLLRCLCERGLKCGLISVEEDREKIAGNYLADAADVPNARLAGCEVLQKDEWDRIAKGIVKLAPMKLVGVDTASSLADVTGMIDVLALQHQCDVIAVDHLHIVRPERKFENRVIELDHITGAIRATFKRHEVCGVLVCQLSRPPDKNKGEYQPDVTDIRGSGSIEEQADSILLLNRQDYWHAGESDYDFDQLMEVVIAKNRNGQRGRVFLKAELEYQRFRELTLKEAQEAAAKRQGSWT